MSQNQKRNGATGMRRQSDVHQGGTGAGRQKGGFAVGLIVGLVIGLIAALGVALYVTKVPIPFVNKVPQRTADQDAAELEKNRNWDPNSALSGKGSANNVKPVPGVPAPAGATGSVAAPTVVQPNLARPAPRSSDFPTPAVTGNVTSTVPQAGAGSDATTTATTSRPPPTSPFGRAGGDGPVATGPDPFIYFVQAGAYGRSEDAEQQRAKLALLGMAGKLSERDQAGRIVYRVRIGPFDKRTDADSAKQRLVSAGVESALVRVQR